MEFSATRRGVLGLAAFAASGGVRAASPGSPAVVELFTSQGCSSCPPADRLLGELARRPGILALSHHVNYWDRLGWKDPYSSPEATQRQRDYALALRLRTLYTPQMVVDGRIDVVGNDAPAVERALARPRGPAALDLKLERVGATLVLRGGSATELLRVRRIDFLAHAPATRVLAGENRGRALAHVNVVRVIGAAVVWNGAEMRWSDAPELATAALVETRDGHVVGAAWVPAA